MAYKLQKIKNRELFMTASATASASVQGNKSKHTKAKCLQHFVFYIDCFSVCLFIALSKAKFAQKSHIVLFSPY